MAVLALQCPSCSLRITVTSVATDEDFTRLRDQLRTHLEDEHGVPPDAAELASRAVSWHPVAGED